MNEAIVSHLKQMLFSDIKSIHLPDNSSSARRAKQRLESVAEYSPAFLALLAEPWVTGEISERTTKILENSARVHLYARILDDALDEGLPVFRSNLLRAQPLFWSTIQNIGQLISTELANEAVQLIHETVSAVQTDDQKRNPWLWGPKNHHMLLGPLLLSERSADYQECTQGLSNIIALVQAGDEWRQGEIISHEQRTSLLEFLEHCLDKDIIQSLTKGGWSGIAERTLWDARQLLNALSSH